jgi:alkylation response protein AidB-like acyl-CoA dehydrogenase
MRFSDSESQELLRTNTRNFLADRFPADRLYAIERGDEELTRELAGEFASLGWMGLTVPESDGGTGASLLDAAVVAEEFGYAAVPAPVSASIVAGALLAQAGGQGEHLAELASGARRYTVSEETRRRGHYGPAGLKLRAGLAATGGSVTGVLPLVAHANISDVVLAPLTIDGEPAFAALPLDGARIQQRPLLDRRTYFDVTFDGQPLDGATVLAHGPAAEALHERADSLSTAFGLVEALGAMQRVLEMTASYIANRVQFGQPVAKFQAARHRAAEMLMATETSRWATYHAMWQLQREGGDPSEVWLAKHWLVRNVERIYVNSHMLHGGVGVGMDYPLHLYTLFLAGAVVRAGAMNEVNRRIVDELRIPALAS